MNIEIGKKYKLRDGRVTSAMRPNDNTNKAVVLSYPYMAEVDGLILTWASTGSYWNSDEENDRDLVAEVLEAPSLTFAPLKLEAGKRYRARNGRVTSELTLDPGRSGHPFVGDLHGEECSWTETGAWYFELDSGEGRDLIAEYLHEVLASDPKIPGKIRLEAGKRYVRRDGVVTEPMEYSSVSFSSCGNDFKYRARCADRSLPTWREDGSWDINRAPEDMDIVAEYAEEKKTMKLEAGKSYVMRNGGITPPLEFIPEGDREMGLRNFAFAEHSDFVDPEDAELWTADGRWGLEDVPHPQDIVAEYTEAGIYQGMFKGQDPEPDETDYDRGFGEGYETLEAQALGWAEQALEECSVDDDEFARGYRHAVESMLKKVLGLGTKRTVLTEILTRD